MKRSKFSKRGGSKNDKTQVHQVKRDGGLSERQRSTIQSSSPAGAAVAEADRGDQSARENPTPSTVVRRIKEGVGQAIVNATDKAMQGLATRKVERRAPKFPGPVITIIYAVDRPTARACAEANGLRQDQWEWLNGSEILFASQRINIVVWRVGTYYTRKNLMQVEELIEKFNVEYVDAPVDVK